MKTILLSAGFTLFFFSSVFTQTLHTKQKPLPCLDKKFTIVAHIARDTFGQVGITEERILESLDSVNHFFSPICVSFEICEFRIIDNFQYNAPASQGEWTEMKIKHHQKNRINMFFVGAIPFYPLDCGFTDVGAVTNPDGGGVMIIKTCVDSTGKSMAHELGHFFGLLNTSMNAGSELVDGSNCETAGDLICDTPADPFILDFYLPNFLDIQNCRFVFLGRDDNDQFYEPDVGNLMSIYPNKCRCGFTWGQYARMAKVYSDAPRKLW